MSAEHQRDGLADPRGAKASDDGNGGPAGAPSDATVPAGGARDATVRATGASAPAPAGPDKGAGGRDDPLGGDLRRGAGGADRPDLGSLTYRDQFLATLTGVIQSSGATSAAGSSGKSHAPSDVLARLITLQSKLSNIDPHSSLYLHLIVQDMHPEPS